MTKARRKNFTMVVERDPESSWLVGEIVELPGCYTQAPDLSTLVANMEEAIRAYLPAIAADEPLPTFVGTWNLEITA